MRRSVEKEWIDLGPTYYTKNEYETCLKQLDQIGKFLGGDRATINTFKQLKENPKSILDVGCGGGFFTKKLAKLYPEAQIVGIDISKEAIDFAKRNCSFKNVQFLHQPFEFSPNSFDFVTTTLVCHHMSESELINFLKESYTIAKQGVIINDLHRHSLAWLGFSMLCPFFNRLVRHDGKLSIKRSFKKDEWQDYLSAAQIKEYSIKWHWAFRWIVSIWKNNA